MRYLTLHTADNSYEANFIQDKLAEEGIESMMTNQNFTTMMPQMNGMLGAGIQILVDKDDFDRAKQVLEKKKSADHLCCPNCHSTNLGYGLGMQHRLKKLLAIIIALVVFSPVAHIRQTHYCRDCKTEFEG